MRAYVLETRVRSVRHVFGTRDFNDVLETPCTLRMSYLINKTSSNDHFNIAAKLKVQQKGKKM